MTVWIHLIKWGVSSEALCWGGSVLIIVEGGSQRSVWPESGHRLLAAGLGGWAPGGHPSQPPFLEEEEVEEVVEGTLLLSHLSLATYLPSPHLMCTMMEKGDKKTQVALSGCFPGCSLPRSSDYLVVRRSPRRFRGLLRALWHRWKKCSQAIFLGTNINESTWWQIHILCLSRSCLKDGASCRMLPLSVWCLKFVCHMSDICLIFV